MRPVRTDKRLNSSESASPEAEGSRGVLAQRLVRELGVPAILARTDSVTVESALKLASEFYGRLRQHGQPNRALVDSYAGLIALRAAETSRFASLTVNSR